MLCMATTTQASVRSIREKAIFRRWQRFRLNLPIRLVVTREKKTQIASGRANDISEGGVLVFAGIELKTADEVFIEFTPPYSDPVRARGLVRHRRGYNYGIEFRGETSGEREEIERFRTLLRMAAGSTK